MMQQNRSYEQREPEKTPLVDMVFLLLIFFFVALSERASIGQWMGSGDIRQDLPSAKDLGPVGTEHEVVLEVLDPSNPRNISALRAVRQKLLSCSPSCPVPAIPEVEAGFWIVTTPIRDLQQRLGKVGVGECDCDDIAWVVAHYPVLLDSERWEEVATVIVGRLHEMSSTLPPGGSAQLHVRMPPSTPVSLFKVLYEVAYSVNWIQPKYVFVRALHVPS